MLVASLPHPVTRTTSATLCIRNTGAALAFTGQAVGTQDQITLTQGTRRLPNMAGRVRIEYLTGMRPSSLWSVLGKLPERIATATGSALAPWLVLLGMIGGVVFTVLLLWHGASIRGVRRELIVVFALTTCTGALWAGITPAFEKTDETAHFAYVQAFAELGHPPTEFTDTGLLSARLTCWYNGLEILHYRFYTEERPPWSAQVRRSLDRSCAHLSPVYNGAMYMAFQPPAYYALAAGAYKLASGFALPTQILFARFVAVLLAALTAVMTYLLVRELLPDSLWPARAAALSLALQPVFMFNESGVNPDALLVAVATAIALVGARAWRRGLTLRRALALGALAGLGLLSKTNFLALVPSLLLLVAALWWAGGRAERRTRAIRLGASTALTGAIFGLYALVNSVAWHRGLRYRDETYGGPGGSIHRLLEFVWEFFLPRFGQMRNLVASPGIPFIELIENSTTRLGWWNDYGIANTWMPALMAIGILLAIAASWYLIPRARHRPAPVLVAIGCGLLFLAALVWSGYEFSLATGADIIIPRHALPLMALWGLVVACAVAAFKPRWRPPTVGALAAIFLAHTILAITTTTSRFYL
jgi:4-amino-4-deoxy-L-arabinose transferase-like glycosyltransferase